MTRKALITGITGQDGSYLAELLLDLGYEVHGLVRRVALEAPNQRFGRITHLMDRVTLHGASLESYPSIFNVMSRNEFDECYHLAAQSFVAESFADGFSTMNTNINGTHYMLAALRELRPSCRFYFAGSSEMFDHLSDAAIEVIVDHATDPGSPLSLSVVRHAGGAMARAAAEASPMCNRDAHLYLFMAGIAPTPEAATALQYEVQRYRTAVQPYVRGGMWMNFMNGNGLGARARIKEAYDPNAHQRLLALKAKYDPYNTFRFSFQLGGPQ